MNKLQLPLARAVFSRLGQLPDELFPELLAGLSSDEIVAICMIRGLSLCYRDDFWQQLIKLAYNEPDTTREAYDFYYNLYKYDTADKLTKYLVDTEYTAFKAQLPVKYYYHKTYNNEYNWDQLKGILFSARTFEGAVLKINDYLPDFIQQQLDYFSDDVDYNSLTGQEIYRVLFKLDAPESGESITFDYFEKLVVL